MSKCYDENMSRGFAAILILGIVLAVLVLGTALYLKQTQKPLSVSNQITTPNKIVPKQSSSSAQSDETANWKTYNDPQGEFTIMYPDNFKQCNSSGLVVVTFLLDKQLKGCPTIENTSDYELVIDIVKDDPKGVTGKQLLSRHVVLANFEDKIFTQKISGLEAYSVKFKYGPLNQYTELAKNGKLYEFRLQARGDNEESDLRLGNQILSTFKFLD